MRMQNILISVIFSTDVCITGKSLHILMKLPGRLVVSITYSVIFRHYNYPILWIPVIPWEQEYSPYLWTQAGLLDPYNDFIINSLIHFQ